MFKCRIITSILKSKREAVSGIVSNLSGNSSYRVFTSSTSSFAATTTATVRGFYYGFRSLPKVPFPTLLSLLSILNIIFLE